MQLQHEGAEPVNEIEDQESGAKDKVDAQGGVPARYPILLSPTNQVLVPTYDFSTFHCGKINHIKNIY